MTERQASQRAGRRRTIFTVFHHANGMKLSWVSFGRDRGEKVVAWQDVVRIDAFKRDLYVVDLMCLTLRFKDNKTVDIDEEMEGWESLVEKLPEYLPGCREFAEWFEVVAFPAFKPNLTVIYKREETTAVSRVEISLV